MSATLFFDDRLDATLASLLQLSPTFTEERSQPPAARNTSWRLAPTMMLFIGAPLGIALAGGMVMHFVVDLTRRSPAPRAEQHSRQVPRAIAMAVHLRPPLIPADEPARAMLALPPAPGLPSASAAQRETDATRPANSRVRTLMAVKERDDGSHPHQSLTAVHPARPDHLILQLAEEPAMLNLGSHGVEPTVPPARVKPEAGHRALAAEAAGVVRSTAPSTVDHPGAQAETPSAPAPTAMAPILLGMPAGQKPSAPQRDRREAVAAMRDLRRE